MPAIRTSAPSAEPWSLAEVKAHLRVDHNDQDALITGYLETARTAAEDRTGRTLCTTSWRLTVDAFSPALRLPNPRALAVASVKYLDEAGVERTLSPTDYLLDDVSEPGYVVPAYGKAWPATLDRINAVVVDYTAGYGAAAAAIPMPIRSWVLLAVSELYRHGGLTGDTKAIPHDFAASLLDYYIVYG